MRPIKRACAATVVAVAAVLTGCGGTADDPNVVDLLTRSGSYEKNEHTLRVAENILVGKCMTAKGFWYPDQVDGPSPAKDDLTLTLKERRREGFGLFQTYSAKPEGQNHKLPASEERVRKLPPEEQAAYNLAMMGADSDRQAIKLPDGGEVGFPSTGCVAEARRQLYGDLLVWARVAHVPAALESRVARRIDTDPVYVEAETAWRDCMKRQGYAYQKPGDGYTDLQARYRKEGPSQRLRRQEIAIAVADTECAQLAEIPKAVRTAKQHGVADLPDIEQKALRELTGSWLAAVARARQLAERRAR